jgi:hypothetical protein
MINFEKNHYKMKKRLVMLIISLEIFACQNDTSILTTAFKLPKKLKEVSGIVCANNLIWTIEDSGNENIIYGLDKNGNIEKELIIKNTPNIDWEDITKDKKGNLYIGDFGNNDNTRKDLCIYKIDKQSLHQNIAKPAYKVNFNYPEQKKFPPKKKELYYDAEGFIELNNFFYIFTKNRSKHFDGTTLLYKIPNQAGHHEAKLIGSFKTCDNYNNCVITSMAISPDESKIVLLGHNKIWVMDDFEGDHFLAGTKSEIDLKHNSQKEAICFKDNNTLLIADEKTKGIGGKIYEMKLK